MSNVKTRYDNDNFYTLARLAVTKFLRHPDHSSEHRGEEFGHENFDFEHEITGINHDIWNENRTRLLDFACGPALISQNFAPYVKQIVGVDISQEMVDIYNARVANQGISEDEMKALCLDLLGDDFDLARIKLGVFDAAVCSMAYHHIDDVDLITERVVQLLKPGGWYFVLDHEGGGHSHHHHHSQDNHNPSQKHENDHNHKIRVDMTDDEAAKIGVAHKHGLSDDTVSNAFSKAGLTNISVEKAFKIRMWFTEDRLYPYAEPKDKDTLESKIDEDGNTVYKISRNLMIVSGQKK